MLIILDHMIYLDQILHIYTSLHCPATGTCMQNDDEASPSISSAGRGLLVKILLTIEPHVIF